MLLRPATPADIPRIVTLERLPESRRFVGQWSEERHRRALSDDDTRYLVCESESGDVLAYAILRGLSEDSGSIELKRIVVAAPGKGLGRKILEEVIQMVFEDLKAHRLVLDVFEDNARARHLYQRLGFVQEGVLREATLRDGQYLPLHLMSMLKVEYASRNRG